MNLSIKLDREENRLQKTLLEDHDLESFASAILKQVCTQIDAKVAQLYLYSEETNKLKRILNCGKAKALEPMQMPKAGEALINSQQIILALPQGQKVIGYIICQNFDFETAESQIKSLLELSTIAGIKLKALLEVENLKRKIELINDHFLGFETNGEGHIHRVSQPFLDRLGETQESVIGKLPEDILVNHLTNGVDVDFSQQAEMAIKTPNGDEIWVENHDFVIQDAFGEQTGKLVLHQDITRRKEAEKLSIKDDLTKLFNRRFFNQIFSKEIASVKRHDRALTFMLIDIDNFKKYNDTYGHLEGDRVLKKVATTIAHCFRRNSDYVFRLGGEEFGVLASIELEEDAEKLANLMRESIQHLAIEHSGNLPCKVVTISTGLVTITAKDVSDQEELYKLADIALYESKESGRNRVTVSGQTDDIELF